MKIKSDEKKNKKPINWNGVKWKPSSGWSVDGFLQTTWGALLFAIICYVVGFFVWDTNALLSFIIMGIGVTFFLNRKDSFGEKIGFSVVVVLVFMIFATVDLMNNEKLNTETIVKYDKVEFIDSTEKLIIYAVEPVKQTIVINKMSTEQYFTVKNSTDLNISIVYTPKSDYYDYKAGKISEHNYKYKIAYDGKVWESYSFEKDEKWF